MEYMPLWTMKQMEQGSCHKFKKICSDFTQTKIFKIQGTPLTVIHNKYTSKLEKNLITKMLNTMGIDINV